MMLLSPIRQLQGSEAQPKFLAITSELGYVEDGVYYSDENCKDNLSAMVELLDQEKLKFFL